MTQWFRRNVRESYRTVRTWVARINAFLQEHITGMSTVQLFRREARSFGRFEDVNRKHRDANIDSILFYAVFYPAIEIIGALASALIIWFGGRWTLQGTLTLGSLVAFLLYSGRFFRPISDMSEKFNVLQAAMASSERIFKLLDTPVQIETRNVTGDAGRTSDRAAGPGDQRRAGAPVRAAGHIVFDHVWFAYNTPPGQEPDYVLRDVSFEVRPGERVGVVGATGAGKSTLINLLLRFYDVTRGPDPGRRCRCARDWTCAHLRGLFSLVLQDVHLFSGTIAANIRLGNAAISDEAVRAAAARGARGRVHRATARRLTTALSPSAAPRSRSGRSSCCRSPARWPSTRASWCSTRRPRASTPKPRS